MMEANDLPAEQLFESIARFIADSQALLEADKLLELNGLDDQVQVLCEAVLLLSQDERLHYADRLQQLLTDLKQLAENMAARRDVLAEEIRQVSSHKKANTAYRVVEASDGFPNPNKDTE